MQRFSLVDITTPADIQTIVRELLNVGASLLLPTLKERMELLHEQLLHGKHLTTGQQMLLGIILNSLEEPMHVAALLGYSNVPEKLDPKDLYILETLMSTLLTSFSAHSVSAFVRICFIFLIFFMGVLGGKSDEYFATQRKGSEDSVAEHQQPENKSFEKIVVFLTKSFIGSLRGLAQ